MAPRPTTRLAPSPTGTLHLGNARTFLINWALARQTGQHIVLRQEDLDTTRIRPGAAEEATELLRWLGLDWDSGPYHQSEDLTPYRDALRTLIDAGLAYPCTLTRKEMERAQSAPHAEDGESRAPQSSRPAAGDLPVQVDDSELLKPGPAAWRLIVPEGPVAYEDAFYGAGEDDVQSQSGDFIIATKNGMPAYQLAVVVDDARQGVTEIVRGDDLLTSTARQVLLYHLLHLGTPPRYIHVPLVLAADGRRLAKRHNDTQLTFYRDIGVPAERLIGLIAYWSGVATTRAPMSAATFCEQFSLDRLPKTPAVFTEEDAAWLIQDGDSAT